MQLYDYQQAFEASDKTTQAMRNAIKQWFALYYRSTSDGTSDPCQRIAYTVVNKIGKSAFSEYQASANDPFVRQVLAGLDAVRQDAVQLVLVGGECYLKPYPDGGAMRFGVIGRDNILIFARNAFGEPVDVGTAERSTYGKWYYTLLERRTVDGHGYLTIENRLYRSPEASQLGTRVALSENPAYAQLAERYTFQEPIGSVGLVYMRTPNVNCIDGSPDGVSVYAAAAGLIDSIDRNEAQLSGEFERGQSRIIVSADMLGSGGLTDHVFVGLDDDPESVGITVFAPALREQSYLARKQEYLRNIESLIGLKRGMLSDANVEERTATEIASSSAEFNLTVMQYQRMWEAAVHQAVALCAVLAGVYRIAKVSDQTVIIDWGNGVLYDQDKLWEDYRQMVDRGLIMPEIALGWRFHMPSDTPEQRSQIRKRFMPLSE